MKVSHLNGLIKNLLSYEKCKNYYRPLTDLKSDSFSQTVFGSSLLETNTFCVWFHIFMCYEMTGKNAIPV